MAVHRSNLLLFSGLDVEVLARVHPFVRRATHFDGPRSRCRPGKLDVVGKLPPLCLSRTDVVLQK